MTFNIDNPNLCFKWIGDETVCYPSEVGYNSHGKWSTLGEIREVEQFERGNPFPETSLPDTTKAMWIAPEKRTALRYLRPVNEWNQIMDRHKPLTNEQIYLLEDIQEIVLEKDDQILWRDPDDGYLLVRKNG